MSDGPLWQLGAAGAILFSAGVSGMDYHETS
jgi:hypothetical protein